jgi:hypothetical protein
MDEAIANSKGKFLWDISQKQNQHTRSREVFRRLLAVGPAFLHINLKGVFL